MLANKAWRESRSRFLLSAVTLGWFCSLVVAMRPVLRAAAARPFAQFVEDSIYTGSIRNLFCLFVIVLGLGGLRQEAARGSAPFTLSLPVTRQRLVALRAAVGVAEVIALALVPTAAVLGLAPFQHEVYSVADAVRFSTQWAVTGSVIFAVALLFSTWLSSGSAALLGSILAVCVYALLLSVSPIGRVPALNVFDIMGHAHPGLGRLLGTSLASFAIVAAAARLTENQDF